MEEKTTQDIFLLLMISGVKFSYTEFISMSKEEQEAFLVAAEIYNEYKTTSLKEIIADVMLPSEDVLHNSEVEKRAMEAQKRFYANSGNA